LKQFSGIYFIFETKIRLAAISPIANHSLDGHLLPAGIPNRELLPPPGIPLRLLPPER
jgi:hypothetical protein